MSFFKSIGKGFTSLEHQLGKATRSFGHTIEKPEILIPVAVGILGVAATIATGGLAAPLAAEAEVAAIGSFAAVEIGSSVAAEVAASEFIAVGGAEVVGLSQPLLAEAVEIGVADLGSVGSSLAPVAEETSMLSRFGLGGGGRAFRAAGRLSQYTSRVAPIVSKASKIISKVAPIVGLAGTAVELVQGSKIEGEEKATSKKVSQLSKLIKGVGQVGGAISGQDTSGLQTLGEQVASISQEIETVEKGVSGLKKIGDSISGVSQELQDLQTQAHSQQIDEQHFESKLVSRVLAEERELEGVVDDLAERLEESFIKTFDFDSMTDLMNRLESDDIVDFLARNQDDFNKLSKANQNNILDLAIQKGV